MKGMTGRYPSEVVRVTGAVLTPFVAMFGLYVIAHGHYGPGGGFAGGVVLAVAALLPRLVLNEEAAHKAMPVIVGPLALTIGMLLFVLIGLVPLAAGGMFLDYAEVGIGDLAASRLRYLGILVVEVAVGLAVFGAMLVIFDALAERSRQ